MTTRRSDTLVEEESTYHCIARCVRRAFLCGTDSYTGKNFDYRKDWVYERLQFLVLIFTIEALAYALMDNHMHTMLRTRPDLLESLSNREVATRWLMLYPPKGDTPEVLNDAIERLSRDKKRIRKLRKRLGSISWFMKSLNEFIARKANLEDGCKGRFWEGRFKCQRLVGEQALLTCSAYIDLNLIRAGKAKTPESSEYTSAYERIELRKQRKAVDKTGHKATMERRPPGLLSRWRQGCSGESYYRLSRRARLRSIAVDDHWLTPIQDTKKRRGYLSLSLEEYLMVLDTTGRIVKDGKRGSIPPELEPILVRVGIKPEGWLPAVQELGNSFSFAVADPDTMGRIAKPLGRLWLKGISMARKVFV